MSPVVSFRLSMACISLGVRGGLPWPWFCTNRPSWGQGVLRLCRTGELLSDSHLETQHSIFFPGVHRLQSHRRRNVPRHPNNAGRGVSNGPVDMVGIFQDLGGPEPPPVKHLFRPQPGCGKQMVEMESFLDWENLFSKGTKLKSLGCIWKNSEEYSYIARSIEWRKMEFDIIQTASNVSWGDSVCNYYTLWVSS